MEKVKWCHRGSGACIPQGLLEEETFELRPEGGGRGSKAESCSNRVKRLQREGSWV